MDGYSTKNLEGAPLMCAVIVALAVAVLVGLNFGFSGHVQF